MKIGVISDTHGSLEAWKKAMEGPFQGADLIIHAGDILYHGPRNPFPKGYGGMELAEAINTSPIPVIAAKGNCDASIDQQVLKIPIQSPYLLVQQGDLRIIASHGDFLDEEDMVELAERYGAHIFISGHTHVPNLRYIRGRVLLNPGSPSLSKMIDRTPTVALIEGRLVKILRLDNGESLDQLSI
jgi:putative phosphoesterase